MTAPKPPRFALNLDHFDGPRPFDRTLLKKLGHPKHALEHLKGALKRDADVTDAEHRGLLLLALSEIGVAHGLVAKKQAEAAS